MATKLVAVQNYLKRIGFYEKQTENGVEEEDPDMPPPPLNSDTDSIAELLNDTPEGSEAASPVPSQPVAEDEAPEGEAVAEVEAEPAPKSEYDDRQESLLRRCLKLWLRYPDPMLEILSPINTDPPPNGVSAELPAPTPEFVATVIRVPKNPSVLKGGYLLVPNSDSTRWVKRFVELRRPYLHIHNVADGEEVAIVSLRNCRVDSQPGILGLLNGDDYQHGHEEPNGANGNGNRDSNGGGGAYKPGHRRTSSGRLISTIWTGTGLNLNGGGAGGGMTKLSERLQAGVFAIYGTDNTWLFAARSEREKMDWILRIDQSFLTSSPSVQGSVSGSGAVSPLPMGSWME
jgi:kinesin family protein 1